MPNSDYHFRSLGESAFVRAVREVLQKELSPERWKMGGGDSLTAACLPLVRELELAYGPGLVAQVWMERPQSDRVSCKFEIAKKIKGISSSKNLKIREQSASDVRTHLVQCGLPEGIIASKKSTVVRLPIESSGNDFGAVDENEKAAQNSLAVRKIIPFFAFLESALFGFKFANVISVSECSTDETPMATDLFEIDDNGSFQI